MLGPARSLALEVEAIEPTLEFYRGTLGLPVRERDGDYVLLDAGSCSLALRPIDSLPRGGAHVHYAFAVTPGAYDEYAGRLSPHHDLEERTFGDARSLYCFDPAGHCVELGERGEGEGITGVFEIVLEVTDLETATERYRDVGFTVVDRGTDRRRVRLTSGDLDLELWEPQYGIANARGGVHVDFAVATADPETVVDEIDREEWRIAETDGGLRLRDWDGHSLTLRREPDLS